MVDAAGTLFSLTEQSQTGLRDIMLDQLPAEIIEQVLGHLPSVSAILNLSSANRKLHKIISDTDNRVFRAFVQTSFPTISSKPPWREAAFELTSRSRAWDRRAFIARECIPPAGDASREAPHRTQRFGHVTRVDSYEHGGREVVAIGAGGRLRIRSSQGRSQRWTSYCSTTDDDAQTDILDVHLLRPHQVRATDGECAIIRRRNGEIVKLESECTENQFRVANEYLPPGEPQCMDVGMEQDPLVAVGTTTAVQILPLGAENQQRVLPIHELTQRVNPDRRKGCLEFLSSSKLVLGYQYLKSKPTSTIDILEITEAGVVATQLMNKDDEIVHGRSRGRKAVTSLAVVESSTNSLFLSGWNSGIASLHDLRTGQIVRDYSDNVDDDQIWSLLPIGRERFLAGSSTNACLKIFDMRMDARVYAYPGRVRSNAPSRSALAKHSNPDALTHGRARGLWQRDINIFVAPLTSFNKLPWQPLPAQTDSRRLQRYRGSIYSLSSPSPSSSKVYTGIENHVIELDFVNTDDIVVNRSGIADRVLDHGPVLNLSCYERPRPGHESTDTILLRKQADWQDRAVKSEDCEAGWDQRWRLRTPSRKGWETPRHRTVMYRDRA